MADFFLKYREGEGLNLSSNALPSQRDFRSTGIATLNIVCDNLKTCQIINKPETNSRKFSWAIAPSHAEEASPFPQKETIYILNADNYKSMMDSHPGSIGILALMPNDEVPPNAIQEPLCNRLVVIKPKNPNTKETPMELLSFLQSLFFKLYIWRSTLSSLIEEHAQMQDLLDASSQYLNGFVDVSDATFNLLAYTRDIEPPDAISKQLVTNGTHSKTVIDRVQENGIMEAWSQQTGVEVFQPFKEIPFPSMSKIMWKGNDYLGHVVMICSIKNPSLGDIDLFETFADAACKLMIELTAISGDTGSGGTTPVSSFLSTLLDGAKLKNGQIEKQLSLLGLEEDKEFRIAIIEPKEKSLSTNLSYVITELNTKFPSRYFTAFKYENYAFAFLHGRDWRGEYETRDTKLMREFCIANNCFGYFSDRFHKITDVRNAYKQTLLAAHYRESINAELSPLGDDKPTCLYFFEDAFCFYLFSDHVDDESISEWLDDTSFREFCMNSTVLDEMAKATSAGETNDIKLLYFYLFYERKATPTATALHMHRNNILYRIASIERRYALDLSRNETRLRLQTCFLYKILASKKFRELISR